MEIYNIAMSLERAYSPEPKEQQGATLFVKVRNYPYRLGLDGDPNKLVAEGVGNCTRKHLYLLPRLRGLGYKVDVGMAVFDWRQLPIPNEILSLLKDPIQSHMFLFVNNKPVDATWPPHVPGFSSNDWNGVDATPIGVPALKIVKPTPFNDAFNCWLAGFESGKIS